MDAKTLTDAQMEQLKTSNTAVREILGAHLSIQGLKAEFSDGTLRLSGTAADQATRERALALSSQVAGVRRVEDRMQVGAPGAAPTAAGTSGGRSYTVKKGDTLSAIAQRELGAASRWKEIFEANRGLLNDPDKIQPGQVLALPQT